MSVMSFERKRLRGSGVCAFLVVALLLGASSSLLGARVGWTQEITWVRQLGTNQNDGGFGVAVDPIGFVYIVGDVDGIMPGQVSAGGTDVLLRKYDLAGNAVWTKQFGSAGSDVGNGAKVDRSQHVIVVG